MKKRSFTIGAIAGASALIVAVPFVAQFAAAQSSSSSAAPQAQEGRLDVQGAPDTPFDPKVGGHVGANGQREELLTGDNASKATAAALAAVPGGTVDRVETDTEGDVYEAHMTKADGSHVTVKFDGSFNVTRIEDGPGGHGGR